MNPGYAKFREAEIARIVILILVTIAATLLIPSFMFSSVKSSGKASGFVAGFTTANLTPYISLVLDVDSVYFGTMQRKGTANTLSNSPIPFILNNDGNVLLNVTIKASATLFTGTGGGNNTSTFQFAAGNCSVSTCGAAENNAFNWSESITSWQNFTDVEQKVVAYLNFTNETDEAEVEIKITIPSDEPLGNKSVNIIFTASEA